MSTIFSMFGEMGYLSENTSLTIGSSIFVLIIMLIAFIFIMYIQGEITTNLILNPYDEITKKKLYGYRLIGLKGDGTLEYLETYNPIIKEFSFPGLKNHDSIEQLIDIYINNTDKYDGIAMSYSESLRYLKKYPQLISSHNFDNEPTSIIVNKKHIKLLDDINKIILNLRDSLYLQRICLSSFGEKSIDNICSIH